MMQTQCGRAAKGKAHLRRKNLAETDPKRRPRKIGRPRHHMIIVSSEPPVCQPPALTRKKTVDAEQYDHLDEAFRFKTREQPGCCGGVKARAGAEINHQASGKTCRTQKNADRPVFHLRSPSDTRGEPSASLEPAISGDDLDKEPRISARYSEAQPAHE